MNPNDEERITRWIDGDLVVAVLVRIEFDFHSVAVKESLIVVLCCGDV